MVGDNHKIKIGGEGVGVEDILRNNQVDGDVKALGMKDIQKRKLGGRGGKRSGSERHPKI